MSLYFLISFSLTRSFPFGCTAWLEALASACLRSIDAAVLSWCHHTWHLSGCQGCKLRFSMIAQRALIKAKPPGTYELSCSLGSLASWPFSDWAVAQDQIGIFIHEHLKTVFLRFYLTFNYVCLCGNCVHVGAGACRGSNWYRIFWRWSYRKSQVAYWEPNLGSLQA